MGDTKDKDVCDIDAQDDKEIEEELDNDTNNEEINENDTESKNITNENANSTSGEEKQSVPEPDKAQLKSQFELFSKFGEKSSDGTTIKLSQSDKWFKQAGLIKPKGISTTDTGIAFRKVSKRAPKLSFPAWCQYLEEISTTKKRNVNAIKNKLIECGPPGITGGTKIQVSRIETPH